MERKFDFATGLLFVATGLFMGFLGLIMGVHTTIRSIDRWVEHTECVKQETKADEHVTMYGCIENGKRIVVLLEN